MNRKPSHIGTLKVTGLVAKYVSFSFHQTGTVFMHKLGVVIDDRAAMFAVLQSTAHGDWSWRKSSTLGGSTINYSLTDAFETFPFPENIDRLETVGEHYHQYRQAIMQDRKEGLTQIYNRFHDSAEASADIAELRHMHVELDHAVAIAYDWSDVDLGHCFYETNLGLRYTISEDARRKVLDRLLTLNHQRHAEEGSHRLKLTAQSKSTTKRGRKARGGGGNAVNDLFDPGRSEV